jgi:pSer/pThr/pTyr-binding forkhead associated (FHA) protein
MTYLDFFVDHKHFLRMSVGADAVAIGRGHGSDVQLTSPTVSRIHALITADDDGNHWIENLSPNGTRLNATMVEGRIMLEPKDRVYIADYAMIYHPGAPPSTNGEEEETLFPGG